MNLTDITPDLSVCGQISPDDMAQIAEQGFATIICNRPDGEQPLQPSVDEIAKSAQAAGITVHYLPIVPGGINAEAVAAFSRLLDEADGKVLAYCRTGNRCTMLWQAAQTNA